LTDTSQSGSKPGARDTIVETLRTRLLRGVQAGTLRAGDRLPSGRDLAREFGVDHRTIIDAYRELVGEQLVEMRPRGGVYVTARPTSVGGIPALPEKWITSILVEGLTREIPGPDLYEWLRRSLETLRLRAVVIAQTDDQVAGLCRELRDDYGFEVTGLNAEQAQAGSTASLALRHADLIVTTEAHRTLVEELGSQLGKPVTVIHVRPDLLAGEWGLFLRRPVYVVVASEDFENVVRRFFADVPKAENLRILVLGRDDLTTIPEGAPTYVTQRARQSIGNIALRGRIMPAARTISSESARELFAFIVRSNLAAVARLDR
jgi:DNA-binding transcriptional regulator YhcF (GntR family)